MLNKRLAEIQQQLKAPKNQRNNFGQYNYRSCEDILEAVKPLLGDLTLVICDEIVLIGERYYVKATATVSDGTEKSSSVAYARECADRKGMDESQITGSASSYARKYALNGLFAIDDTKDADTQDNSNKGAPVKAKVITPIEKPVVKEVLQQPVTTSQVAKATEKQIKAIYAIATNMTASEKEAYGTIDPTTMTMKEASEFIGKYGIGKF